MHGGQTLREAEAPSGPRCCRSLGARLQGGAGRGVLLMLSYPWGFFPRSCLPWGSGVSPALVGCSAPLSNPPTFWNIPLVPGLMGVWQAALQILLL